MPAERAVTASIPKATLPADRPAATGGTPVRDSVAQLNVAAQSDPRAVLGVLAFWIGRRD